MTAANSGEVAGRAAHVPAALAAGAVLGPVPAYQDAERAVTALYDAHYRSLVRLAELLVGDLPTAEHVVQESFVAMHGRWRRLRDREMALSYLRKSVVNRSRSAAWQRAMVDRRSRRPSLAAPSTEQGAGAPLEQSAVAAALAALPPRQREALVLRYYGDLPQAQIASTMGISQVAVERHTARARSALGAVLERQA
jgi:RNA polymerase sigma-70 factor (sigma-E family)